MQGVGSRERGGVHFCMTGDPLSRLSLVMACGYGSAKDNSLTGRRRVLPSRCCPLLNHAVEKPLSSGDVVGDGIAETWGGEFLGGRTTAHDNRLLFTFIDDYPAGITRNSYKKRRATGGKQPQYKKKRQYELGRLATKPSPLPLPSPHLPLTTIPPSLLPSAFPLGASPAHQLTQKFRDSAGLLPTQGSGLSA